MRCCSVEGVAISAASRLSTTMTPHAPTDPRRRGPPTRRERSSPTTSAADGYELLEADCARDAARLMATRFPDLAIVDLGLPDRDGLELMREVRDADRVAGGSTPSCRCSSCPAAASELDRLRGLRPRLRRLHGQAVQLSRSSTPGSSRCCAAASTAGAGPDARRTARDRQPLPRCLAPRRAASSSRRRSSRCCARWPRSRRACSPGTSCCAASGGTGRSARPGRWTRTPRVLRKKLSARGDHFIVNVWGVGYRLLDGSLE